VLSKFQVALTPEIVKTVPIFSLNNLIFAVSAKSWLKFWGDQTPLAPWFAPNLSFLEKTPPALQTA